MVRSFLLVSLNSVSRHADVVQVTQSRLTRSDQRGFTLIELMVTMFLTAILMAMAVGGWIAYQRAHAQADSAREIAGVLRQAQVRAQAEDATYRVDFGATPARTYSLYKYDGTNWNLVSSYETEDNAVKITGADFAAISGDPSEPDATSCYFFGRGTATKGSVSVIRDGSSKTYTIDVEGFTGRVKYDNS